MLIKYLTISTNVRRYQTHHRWQFFVSGRQHTGALCVQHISCFPVLPGSAEAQVVWGGIVKCLLIAKFIGDISAKKYQNPFTSERKLTFTFAICCRPSVCLSSVVCLSVTFVRPTQAVQIFGNISMALGTLAIHWHPLKISRRSSQENPSTRGVKHKRGSQV